LAIGRFGRSIGSVCHERAFMAAVVNDQLWSEAVDPTIWVTEVIIANKVAVPGPNCAHQNLPYIQVLTVQREWQKLGQAV
jgi:cytolysin (calcineurin-like family phosphatase)